MTRSLAILAALASLAAANQAGAEDSPPSVRDGISVGSIKIVNHPGVGIVVGIDKGTTAAPGDGVIDLLVVAQTKHVVDPWEGGGILQLDSGTLRIIRQRGTPSLQLSVGPPAPIDSDHPYLAYQVRALSQYAGAGVRVKLEDIGTLPLLAEFPPVPSSGDEAEAQEILRRLIHEIEGGADPTSQTVCRPCYPDPPPDIDPWPGGGGPTRICTAVCPNGECIARCHWPSRPLCSCPGGQAVCVCRD